MRTTHAIIALAATALAATIAVADTGAVKTAFSNASTTLNLAAIPVVPTPGAVVLGFLGVAAMVRGRRN